MPQAMGLIAPNLRSVFHHRENRKARGAVMLGATLAGIAFSNASAFGSPANNPRIPSADKISQIYQQLLA